MDGQRANGTSVGLLEQVAPVWVQVQDQPDRDTVRRWNGLVAATPHTDVTQLSTWAQLRGRAGYTPVYLFAFAGPELIGGAMVLYRPGLPGMGAIAYLPVGPVLPAGGPYRDAVRYALGESLTRLARLRFAALFVQPMPGDEDVSEELLRHGFRPSDAGIAPAASIAIDLGRPLAQLRAGMRSGTRSAVNRATNRGVVVRPAGEDDLPAVAALLAESADHHGFPATSPEHLHALYAALAPGGHLALFLAERDGRPLACDVLSSCGGTLRLRLTGMRRDEQTRTLGATALLRWETIRWAKERGYRALDLGGIAAAAVDPIRAGRANLAARVDGRAYYKASFGGAAFHHPTAVELFPSAPVRLGYDALRRTAAGNRMLARAKELARGIRPRTG